MSKWVQFYHKINKFDLVNMRFTDEEEIVELMYSSFSLYSSSIIIYNFW